MDKKKVCIISSVHYPFDVRIFYKEALSLKKSGYEVILIARHEKSEVVDGIRVVGLPKARNRLMRLLLGPFQILPLAMNESAHFYHLHDPELLSIAPLLKLLTKGKIIFDVHEDISKQILTKHWIPRILRKPFSYFYRLVELCLLLFVDHIIIAEDSYINNYRSRNNVIAIRNFFLPFGQNVPNGLDFVKKRREEKIPFSLVYVGSVTKLRGALELVKLAHKIKLRGFDQIRLNIVGPIIPRELEEELTRLILTYDLKDNVQLHGRIPYSEVQRITLNSEIGLALLHPHPNCMNSLLTKFFEYMAVGLPIVASNFPLWQELIEGEKSGLTVDPFDLNAAADLIIELFNDPELRRKMGDSGMKAVKNKYSWEREEQKLLQLYEKLGSGQGSTNE